MDPSNDLVDRFKLEVTILSSDHTLHTSYRSDLARGLDKEIGCKSWSRMKEIGVGNCGSVWLEEDTNGSERAVKRISKSIYTRDKIDYKREVAAMAVLSKFERSFVQIYGWYESLDGIYLVMEYFPLGDLGRYMDRQLSKLQIKVIIRQLLKGLWIMHQNEFTHRDLKPQNIFVVKDSPGFWVKIGDFGITKRVPHDGTSLRTEIGTLGYVAPEVLGYHDQESSKYTNAVDLWSLGCICHRLLTMQAPFENPVRMIRYCSGVTKLPIETLRRGNDQAVTFVKRLLMVNPSERYTAETALQSTWLKNLRPQESPHVAPCQSQSQDELPHKIKALSGAIIKQPKPLGKPLSNAYKPARWLLGKVIDYVKTVAIVIGRWTFNKLFQILSGWISRIMIWTCFLYFASQLFTSSGVTAANAQVLLNSREPYEHMGGESLMVLVAVFLVGPMYLWAQLTHPEAQ